MKNINLKNKDLLKRQWFSNSLSTNLGFAILGASLFVYGVFFLLNYLAVNKEQKIKEEVALIEENLAGEEFIGMYDFNMKALDLKSKISKQGLLTQTKNIVTISDNTLPSVSFVSLQVEDKDSYSNYIAKVAVSSYEELAKQVETYKQMENVFDFFLKSSRETDEGLIADFSFSLGEYFNMEEISSEQVENF